MKYIPSINIEYGVQPDFHYIVTPNAEVVTGNLLANYNTGIHSFSIIGTYGTGKSCYLLALERDLKENTSYLIKNRDVFGDVDGFEFLNILGDYDSLSNLLSDKLNCNKSDDVKNVFTALSEYYNSLKRKHKFLFIVIDEFGKILEHAAKNTPEKELYFLQRLAEFVNVHNRNIILITTLHQNFGAYAQRLSETQRNEWMKVKGRYKEFVFSEPVEQLLYLASEQISMKQKPSDYEISIEILGLAKKMKFVSSDLAAKTIKKLYPLDALSAMCITKAIQKYGQNERTLFSFLTAEGSNSLSDYVPKRNETYNVSNVYDYLIYNFYSSLSEVNGDSTNWIAMRVALERISNGCINVNYIPGCEKLIKTIGLLNLFGSASVSLTKDLLLYYAENALGLSNASKLLDVLEKHKIIKYARYKSSYVLFEGTDIDLEDELYKAANVVPMPNASITDLVPFINQKVIAISEEYYRTGTPRYFEFRAVNEPELLQPSNDIDGFVQLVFPLNEDTIEQTKELSRNNHEAVVYVVFKNMEDITRHLYEIKKLQYLLENIVFEDLVAKKEVQNHIKFEKELLNGAVNDSILANNNVTEWIYKGETVIVHSYKAFNKLLSTVCKEVYSETPILRNELFNRQKLSSAISQARVKLLNAMLEANDQEDFGFAENTCPPEKAIYYTIFKDTGMHRKDSNGFYELGAPLNQQIMGLWKTCDDFIKSTIDKPKKITELIKILRTKPIKLKQGVLDFWIPILLYIRQQDFALYNEVGTYVMNINKELFELLLKKPGDFSIKAFNVTGIKYEFFKKYRQFLQKNDNIQLSSSSFMEVFKPFLQYYRSLDEYAKHTCKFNNSSTVCFRDILGNTKDPEKAFFEELPAAFGYNGTELNNSVEFLNEYLSLIKNAIHELNTCYDGLINRLEQHVVTALNLSENYIDYKQELEERYKGVKKHLLTNKSRNFLDRVLAPSQTSKEFFEKISNVILDKRLTELKDKEEEYLQDNLIYLFREIERYVEVSSEDNGKDEVYNFEIASNKYNISRSQTYRLPDNQVKQANKIMENMNKYLSDDNNLNICVLLKMLNEKLSK